MVVRLRPTDPNPRPIPANLAFAVPTEPTGVPLGNRLEAVGDFKYTNRFAVGTM